MYSQPKTVMTMCKNDLESLAVGAIFRFEENAGSAIRERCDAKVRFNSDYLITIKGNERDFQMTAFVSLTSYKDCRLDHFWQKDQHVVHLWNGDDKPPISVIQRDRVMKFNCPIPSPGDFLIRKGSGYEVVDAKSNVRGQYKIACISMLNRLNDNQPSGQAEPGVSLNITTTQGIKFVLCGNGIVRATPYRSCKILHALNKGRGACYGH
jgi:hypothetical protein